MTLSPDQVKDAVLKYCERLMGELSPTFHRPYVGYPQISSSGSPNRVEQYTVWPFGELHDHKITVITDLPSDDSQWQLAYRLLNLEANELRQQLEEAKIYRFKTMEEPAFQVMGEFANFLNEAVEADCPMITHWGVKVQETGEDIEILNIWAATTHDSPITRCKELRREIDSLQERAQGLVAALKNANLAIIDVLQHGDSSDKLRIAHKINSEALNQWKGQPAEAQQ